MKQVSRGSTIAVHITDLDIEASGNCIYDYLEIFDGSTARSPSLGRMCTGQQTHGAIYSTTNVLYVKFRTDMSMAGRGFRLTYASNCTVHLTGIGGVIESPNFPNPYPHNANCSWTVEGDYCAKKIGFSSRFIHFQPRWATI